MPEMPIIPGLGGQSPEPLSLTEFLDMLDPGEVAELVATVTAGAVPEEGADEKALEAETPEEESAETLEEEAAESPEQQDEEVVTGTEDFAALQTQTEAAGEEAQGYRDELDEVLKDAKANEDLGGEPDEVEKLIEEADTLLDEKEDLKAKFDDAVAGEDPNEAAVQGMKIQEIAQHIKGLVEQAHAYAGANQTDEEPSEENPAPALATWADQYSAR